MYILRSSGHETPRCRPLKMNSTTCPRCGRTDFSLCRTPIFVHGMWMFLIHHLSNSGVAFVDDNWLYPWSKPNGSIYDSEGPAKPVEFELGGHTFKVIPN